MKKRTKIFKITLIIIGSLIGLIILVAVGLYLYVNIPEWKGERKNKSFAGQEIKPLTIDGFTFRDLNKNGKLDVYEDTTKSVDERANDLLSLLTINEKASLLVGSGWRSMLGFSYPVSGVAQKTVRGAAGTTIAIQRLGIPFVVLSDGPAGLRIAPTRTNETNTYYATAFPIGTLLASTWDTTLVASVGKAMGNEVLEYGVDVILGPGMNIMRNPLCGRNFEYYSEDPVLTGKIGAAIVNGIQSNGVGTSIKHYAANNQETNRTGNDVRVSQRALREIYLRGFEIVVKDAQPWTVMSSYNKINGTYAAEDRDLLTNILRDEWGFKGIVMSDWFGGSDAVKQVAAGNDLQEPGTDKQKKAISKAIETGTLSETDLNISAKRILNLIIKSPTFNGYKHTDKPDLKAHAIISRQAAGEGMVLLKNNGALPLAGGKNIALFGNMSYDSIAGGTGSGDVNEAYSVSLEEGLKNAGYVVNTTAKEAFKAHKAANKEAFKKLEGFAAMVKSTSPPEMLWRNDQLKNITGTAEVAIVTIGRNSGEGMDRVESDNFLLSQKEQEMIKNVCEVFHAAGKKVLVVLNIGGVIETASWKEQPDAILLAWQGGQEGGNSVADILSGKVNPNAKLTMTFPVALSDHASTKNFDARGIKMNLLSSLGFRKETKPEDQVRNFDYTFYEENIYVGYRYFNTFGVKPSYEFGYGLSYTTFEYSPVKLSSTTFNGNLSATTAITNTGNVAGKEVVQLYVNAPATKMDKPSEELKAFAKTGLLQPGESQTITFRLNPKDLASFDTYSSSWIAEAGKYTVNVGASSLNIKQSATFDLPKEMVVEKVHNALKAQMDIKELKPVK